MNKNQLKEDALFKKEFQYAYHRTAMDNVEGIAKKGFTPGYGDMYGKGWYMCYDLDSQLKSSMSHYGDALIKSEIFSKGVLIFDYNISRKVYGPQDYTLLSQILRHKMYPTELHIPMVLKQLSKKLESTFQRAELSAAWFGHVFVGGSSIEDAERRLSLFFDGYGSQDSFIGSNGLPKIRAMTGAMFSGNHDGNVLIVYNPDTAVPKEYCGVDSDGVMTTGWETVANISVAQKRADNAQLLYKEYGGRIVKLETDLSMDKFKALFPWLSKAQFRNAEIEVDKDNQFIWKDGIWERGDWYGDIWERGTFRQGKWFKGEFRSGTWNAGNFISGVFGSPQYGSSPIWEKGTWTDGTFLDGCAIWRGGRIFRGGFYLDSKVSPSFAEGVEDSDRNLLYLSEEFIEEFMQGVLQESFSYNSLSSEEQDTLYDAFKTAYEKAVGVSWDRRTFDSRAWDWLFFGSVEGGVAVRKQKSGLYKLNATYGSPRKVIEAYKEMINEIGREPIWGMMTLDIAQMLEKLSRKEFRIPPKMFSTTLIPHLSFLFGDGIQSVDNSDGGVWVDTPSGRMKKFFIANKAYYRWTLDTANKNPDKIPVPAPIIKVLTTLLKAFI